MGFGVSPKMVVWRTFALKTAVKSLPLLARKNIANTFKYDLLDVQGRT